MTAKDNIVPLDPARFDDSSRANETTPLTSGTAGITRRMSAPAIQVKELLNRHLAKQLQSMFDDVDDALFDLAENAPCNQQQNVFFESMREVRFKRVEIERDFLQQLQQGFVDLFSDRSRAGNDKAAGISLDDSADALAIMDEDVVEEMVAIDSMVAKFEKLLAGQMSALDARLAHLAGYEVGRFGSEQKVNPATPKKLCHYFANACRILSVDIKARIVIFKLFEKIVLSGLERIYQQANEKLIRANVLPDFRGSLSGSRTTTTTGSRRVSDAPTEQVHLSERAMSVVEAQQAQELAHLISYVPQYGTSLEPGQVGSLTGALQLLQTSSYPVIGSDVLLQLLHNLQRQQGVGVVSSSDTAQPALQRPEDVLTNLATKLAAASDNDEHSIGQRERDVIGLVSMLFQFVLEDRVVSEPMKAAISRLQVPIIKVALNESNFFCSPSHPARRLLNEMTQAVVGWVESENYHTDPLYQMICSTVERVTREYEEDSQIFVDVMADLKSWVDGDSKRTELRKKRLVDAEAGRDESATARAVVKKIIEQQVLHGLPEFIVEFIEKSWGNILFLVYLNQGQHSEPWQAALDTMQHLLWSVAPQRCRDDRSELLSRLPGLLKSLRSGLESVNHDKRAATEFFSQLEHIHMQVMQRTTAVAMPQAAAPKPSTPAGEQSQSQGEASVEANDNVAKTSTAASTITDQMPGIAQAKALAVGQWVEIHEDGNKKRCRLVAILRNSGKRIFISRTGTKAAELEVEEIATMISAGDMVLLEDAQLFDKALTSIIDGLRKQQHVAIGA